MQGSISPWFEPNDYVRGPNGITYSITGYKFNYVYDQDSERFPLDAINQTFTDTFIQAHGIRGLEINPQQRQIKFYVLESSKETLESVMNELYQEAKKMTVSRYLEDAKNLNHAVYSLFGLRYSKFLNQTEERPNTIKLYETQEHVKRPYCASPFESWQDAGMHFMTLLVMPVVQTLFAAFTAIMALVVLPVVLSCLAIKAACEGRSGGGPDFGINEIPVILATILHQIANIVINPCLELISFLTRSIVTIAMQLTDEEALSQANGQTESNDLPVADVVGVTGHAVEGIPVIVVEREEPAFSIPMFGGL